MTTDMTTNEHLLEYMRGYVDGVIYSFVPDRHPAAPKDYHRGFAAGRAAYLSAEKAEQKRMERCPTCAGERTVLDGLGNVAGPCPDCRGTGRRP